MKLLKQVHQGAMRGLAKNLRTRAAILVALAYGFCVLAPSAALALAGNPTSFHCLAELTGIGAPSKHEGVAHSHADSTAHQHDQSGVPDHHSGNGGKADTGNCCGLFCVSALAHDAGVTFGIPAPATAALAAVANGLAGRAPSPLHRPPIA